MMMMALRARSAARSSHHHPHFYYINQTERGGHNSSSSSSSSGTPAGQQPPEAAGLGQAAAPARAPAKQQQPRVEGASAAAEEMQNGQTQERFARLAARVAVLERQLSVLQPQVQQVQQPCTNEGGSNDHHQKQHQHQHNQQEKQHDAGSGNNNNSSDNIGGAVAAEAEEALKALHPSIAKFLSSGYLESQAQLREQLMRHEWDATVRPWTRARGVAQFERWVAEHGPGGGASAGDKGGSDKGQGGKSDDKSSGSGGGKGSGGGGEGGAEPILAPYDAVTRLYENPDDLSALPNARSRGMARSVIAAAEAEERMKVYKVREVIIGKGGLFYFGGVFSKGKHTQHLFPRQFLPQTPRQKINQNKTNPNKPGLQRHRQAAGQRRRHVPVDGPRGAMGGAVAARPAAFCEQEVVGSGLFVFGF
jgi:hypothetical protein